MKEFAVTMKTVAQRAFAIRAESREEANRKLWEMFSISDAMERIIPETEEVSFDLREICDDECEPDEEEDEGAFYCPHCCAEADASGVEGVQRLLHDLAMHTEV